MANIWGLLADPLPRSIYQALFPVLLLIAITNLREDQWRWVTMIAAGALVYVHPHSAVTQAFAVLCGLVVVKPAQASWPAHLLCHFKLALVFLAVVLPYIVHFVHATSVGEITDQALALEISRSSLAAMHGPQRIAAGFLAASWHYVLAILLGLTWLLAAAARSARFHALHRRVVCGRAGHFDYRANHRAHHHGGTRTFTLRIRFRAVAALRHPGRMAVRLPHWN